MHTQLPVTERVFAQRFSATPRGARLARLLALCQLDAWGVPYGSEPSDTAAVIIAELSANAVLHGRLPGRDFQLRLRLDAQPAPPPGPQLALGRPESGALLVEVSDARDDAHPSAASGACVPDADAESGRGLRLVAALAADWGVRGRGPATPGKTVWATVPL